MKSTGNTQNDLLYKEQKQLTGYLDLIRQEKAELENRLKKWYYSKLQKIRFSKTIFTLTNEIEAKENYLSEIEESIKQLS